MWGTGTSLWEVMSTPDNVPIVGLLFFGAVICLVCLRQARQNDALIEKLEADPQLAKTAYRKVEPYEKAGTAEVHTWPNLMRIEFVAAILVTVLLMAWSADAECAARGTFQSERHDEPSEGPVVLPGSAGNAGLFRPVDGRRGDAHADHCGIDGDSLYRREPSWERLLHLSAAPLRDLDISLWVLSDCGCL